MGVPGSADLMVLAAAAQAGGTAYQIEQSLRFDGGSYLTRTNSSAPSNQYKATFSVWVKVDGRKVDTDNYILQNGVSGTPYSNAALYYETNSGWYQFVISNNSNPSTRSGRDSIRDHAAWYHLVFTFDHTQSSSEAGMKLYVNGRQRNGSAFGGETAGGWSDAQNQPLSFLINGRTVGMGRSHQSSNAYFAGYMAEFHCVDGQVLSPTDFGEYDDSNVWRPIQYSGTYGNNGWYLKYDPSAANGIGHDHSGNGNNWTPTNFSTSGAGSDVVYDTPTVNHATMLPTWPFGVSQAYARYYAEGNERYHSGRNSPAMSFPSILLPKSGKYYVEFVITAGGSGGSFYAGNLFVVSAPRSGDSYGTSVTSYEGGYGATTYNGSAGSSGASWRSGPHNVAIAIDMDTGDVEYFLNGTSQSSGTLSAANLALDLCITVSGATGSSTTVTYDINFGRRDFVYTPPTGYTGISTATLPEPAIKNPGEHFKTVLYTGDGQSSQAITGVGFQPDFVWIKNRSSGNNHMLQDVLRGANVSFTSAYGNGEDTNSGNGHVDSFDSDGFTVGWDGANNGGDTNANGASYVAWCWKAGGSGSSNTAGTITSTVSANPTAGFSIVTYTGNGSSGATVGHGLGNKPELILVKRRNATADWAVYNARSGATKYLTLNNTNLLQSSSAYWNNTEPSSTVFTLGVSSEANTSSAPFVAYCFAGIEGFSKIGTYRGNGSDDGIFQYCGFTPAFLLMKSTGTSHWLMLDLERGQHNNPIGYKNSTRESLYANGAAAESGTGLGFKVDFLSNGFKCRAAVSGELNVSGQDYIYIAFAEHPFGGDGVSPAPAR